MLISSQLWLFNFDTYQCCDFAFPVVPLFVKWRCQGKKMQSWPHLEDACPIWDLLQFACWKDDCRVLNRTFTNPRCSCSHMCCDIQKLRALCQLDCSDRFLRPIRAGRMDSFCFGIPRTTICGRGESGESITIENSHQKWRDSDRHG
jgi:hypothetical protein